MMSSDLLEIAHFSKRFGDTVAVDDVSLAVQEGEIVCLLGPSGCGKTTLLRLIAGLETPDGGAIRFDGRDIIGLPTHQRGFGLMFQDYALFPHKNVAQNVAFGLRMAHLDSRSVNERVHKALDLVGLAAMSEREVTALSGGEQQRVALARSLAPRPRLLLLDEPLGSLDRALRERLMNELRAILKSVGVTAITVTHDQQEAFALADRIVVMDRGRALQVGTPERVYRRPASPTVARFLGLTNLLQGEIVDSALQTAIGPLPIPDLPSHHSSANVLLRPEAASTCPNEETITLEGTLTACSFRGRHYQIEITHPAGPCLTFSLRASPAELPAVGQAIRLHLDPYAISLLPTGDGPFLAVTIQKRDAHGRPVLSYSGRPIARSQTSITVEATFRHGPVMVEGIALNQGDQFVEHFYADRWYNIFEVFDGEDGGFKGWYCNITRPAVITRETISADDLALDLVVAPDGRAASLDWDEFEGLLLTPEERDAALAALDELQGLARAGRLPKTKK